MALMIFITSLFLLNKFLCEDLMFLTVPRIRPRYLNTKNNNQIMDKQKLSV